MEASRLPDPGTAIYHPGLRTLRVMVRKLRRLFPGLPRVGFSGRRLRNYLALVYTNREHARYDQLVGSYWSAEFETTVSVTIDRRTVALQPKVCLALYVERTWHNRTFRFRWVAEYTVFGDCATRSATRTGPLLAVAGDLTGSFERYIARRPLLTIPHGGITLTLELPFRKDPVLVVLPSVSGPTLSDQLVEAQRRLAEQEQLVDTLERKLREKEEQHDRLELRRRELAAAVDRLHRSGPLVHQLQKKAARLKRKLKELQPRKGPRPR